MEDIIRYINEGRRIDNRKTDELREIKIMPAVLTRADGSCYIEWGKNKIIVGVYGPREALPQHIQNPTKALVNFVYRMATFSVAERKNPKPARREIEISKVCGEALEKAIIVNRFPNTTIDIYATILDSNAGTRAAALTAAAVAIADAGIPMYDLVSAVAVGRVENTLIVDLIKEEEDAPNAVDMAFAILPHTEEIVLMQMDGEISKEEFDGLIELGIKACKEIYKIQENALKEKYKNKKGEQDE